MNIPELPNSDKEDWQKLFPNINEICPDIFVVKFECPLCKGYSSLIVILPDREDVTQEYIPQCLDCENYSSVNVFRISGKLNIQIEGVPNDKIFFRVEHPPEDYLLDSITDNFNFFEDFTENIQGIKTLLDVEIDSKLGEILRNLLFVNVITVMETYLSDAFINTVLWDKSLIRKLVETTPEFRERKFELNQIYTRLDGLEMEVKTYLLDTIYHNLGKVRQMYKQVLSIDFLPDMSLIYKSVLTRHDIVHRNGKTKDGRVIKIDSNNINLLIVEVEKFIIYVDKQISSLIPNSR